MVERLGISSPSVLRDGFQLDDNTHNAIDQESA